MHVLDDPRTSVEDRLLDNSELETNGWINEDAKQQPRPYNRWWIVGMLTLITGLSCLIGIFVGYQKHHLDEMCTRHISQYSPVLSQVPIKYHRQRFNGSLLKENVFRQDASPEVDAAWESLGANYRTLRVPAEDAAKSGIAPDQVRIKEKYGGGFPANVEGLHHLHCLNLLRQSLYYNYEYYHSRGQGAFSNEDYIVRKHVSHCLDILRQQLMCTIDIGVLGQVWLHPENPSAFVDFNTEHRCRNFEDIREWAEKNQLPEHAPSDFLQPPGEGDRVYPQVP